MQVELSGAHSINCVSLLLRNSKHCEENPSINAGTNPSRIPRIVQACRIRTRTLCFLEEISHAYGQFQFDSDEVHLPFSQMKTYINGFTIYSFPKTETCVEFPQNFRLVNSSLEFWESMRKTWKSARLLALRNVVPVSISSKFLEIPSRQMFNEVPLALNTTVILISWTCNATDTAKDLIWQEHNPLNFFHLSSMVETKRHTTFNTSNLITRN